MRILFLALMLSSCGPAPAPPGAYRGEVIDHDGNPHACTLEITPTAPDRVHIHLGYEDQCDGDGATLSGDLLLPDAGGEFVFDGDSLRGTFFSAIGHEYRIEASPEGAQ
jgi:hypothetical protein